MGWVENYTDETLMPFGKHMGIKLANVPAEYLMWLYDSSEQGKRLSDSKLAKYILENIEALRMEMVKAKQQKFYERK